LAGATERMTTTATKKYLQIGSKCSA